MGKYLPLAVVAASAAAMLLPMAAAFASTAHVLTISKAGGIAVKKHAVLKSGLAKGKTVVFALGTTGSEVTCPKSAFSATVTSNPDRPGTAKESLTSQTFGKCGTNLDGITVSSVVASNLPYDVTVSDKGVVKVSGRSATAPLTFTVTVAYGSSTISCADTATSITGKASNTGNTITFTKQKFTSVSSGTCTELGATARFSGTFGPVKDTSVNGDPKVFVN